MGVRRFSEPGDRAHRDWHFLGRVAHALRHLAGGGDRRARVAGAQVPASWSLDFVVVLSFISLLVPAVRTRADLAAAIVAGAVALIAAGLPYRLSLVVGVDRRHRRGRALRAGEGAMTTWLAIVGVGAGHVPHARLVHRVRRPAQASRTPSAWRSSSCRPRCSPRSWPRACFMPDGRARLHPRQPALDRGPRGPGRGRAHAQRRGHHRRRNGHPVAAPVDAAMR